MSKGREFESLDECLDRLKLMAEDEFGDWDLSENDMHALKTVTSAYDSLKERAEKLVEALELALECSEKNDCFLTSSVEFKMNQALAEWRKDV